MTTQGTSVTLNELQPRAQTHSKSGAINNIPCLLPTLSQTPIGDFPAKGSDAQVSPETGPRGCQLDQWEDAGHYMLHIELGFSISYTALQNFVNTLEQHGLGRTVLLQGLHTFTTQGTSAPLIFLGGLKPSTRVLDWWLRRRKRLVLISCFGDVSQNTQKPREG